MTKIMRRLQIGLFFVITLFSLNVMADSSFFQKIFDKPDKRWMVRLRAVYLQMDQKSDPIPSLGVPRDAIEVRDIFIPELDISFFITKHIAAELVLTYPQMHELHFHNSAIGKFKSGTFKHLPPTLMLQYHFMPDSWFRPYIGGGVNYTFLFDEKIFVPGVTNLRLETGSLGGALQFGFDIKLNKFCKCIPENMFLNADLKKVFIDSKVKTGAGVTISHLDPDPLVVGVGLGVSF